MDRTINRRACISAMSNHDLSRAKVFALFYKKDAVKIQKY